MKLLTPLWGTVLITPRFRGNGQTGSSRRGTLIRDAPAWQAAGSSRRTLEFDPLCQNYQTNAGSPKYSQIYRDG